MRTFELIEKSYGLFACLLACVCVCKYSQIKQNVSRHTRKGEFDLVGGGGGCLFSVTPLPIILDGGRERHSFQLWHSQQQQQQPTTHASEKNTLIFMMKPLN